MTDATTAVYLGDSVYVELEDGMLKLTTNNGHGATNTIFLEPEVYEALTLYVECRCPRMTAAIRRRNLP
jgi:hypothetical protein